MAHDDDPLLADVLADVALDGSTKDLFRRLLQDALQELIESELTPRSARRRTGGPTPGATSATGGRG